MGCVSQIYVNKAITRVSAIRFFFINITVFSQGFFLTLTLIFQDADVLRDLDPFTSKYESFSILAVGRDFAKNSFRYHESPGKTHVWK